MNIIFDPKGTELQNHSSVNKGTTAYRSSGSTGRVQTENFALDISGIVMDNNAYAGHGRTADEVMQEGDQDLVNRRNYMAVMSNSMSDEDFAELQREGFHPGDTEIDTVVSIVDEIKAALLKGGTSVVGYTDTLDEGTLTEITGSETLARELRTQFEDADLPLTTENMGKAASAYKALNEIGELTEGSIKFMLENQLTVNVDNLYFARYGSGQHADIQGQGYYKADNLTGYFARKSDVLELEALQPQIEKVIEESGYEVSEKTLQDAGWIIEKGIPFTKESFEEYQKLQEIVLPFPEEEFAKSMVIAVQDNVKPEKADLTKTESDFQKAVRLTDYQKNEIDHKLQELTNQGNENPEARRRLEEARLVMTVSANLKLLKSGFQIETKPIEEVIEKLKEAQSETDQVLMKEEDPVKALDKGNLYRQMLETMEWIRRSPVEITAKITPDHTLPEVAEKGAVLVRAYQKAGETYEALGTAPRTDLGDSIKKAFRNTEELLDEIGKEYSDDNAKVIRILGYNHMDITLDNFDRVKASSDILSEVIQKLKPEKVLSMIREGQNPLTKTLSELSDFLGQGEDTENQRQGAEQEMESYSRFLYKLEQKKDITREERSAYIGIYRFFRQMEKTDGMALGAVIQSERSATMENLLSALRSSKKSMNYQVDDSFEGVSGKRDGVSISEQIQKGFVQNRTDLEDFLQDSDMEQAEQQFDRDAFEEIRQIMSEENNVALSLLTDYEHPITADMLMAAGEWLRNPVKPFERWKDLLQKKEIKEKEQSSEEDLLDDFNNAEDAGRTTETFYERIRDQFQKYTFEQSPFSLEVREMRLLYKQVGFMRSMAREENYTLPLEIDGNLTAVKLKMIHKDGQASKVSITLETEAIGKNAAEFTFQKEELSGYSVCSSKEGAQRLSENGELLNQMLSEEEVNMGDIHFVHSKELELQEFSLKAEKDRKQGRASNILYKAARAYIRFVSRVSRKEV